MEVTLEENGNTARTLKVTVPQEQYAKQLDARLRHLSKTLRIKGFRPGRVPLQIVRQRHLQEAHETVASKLIDSSLREALQMKQLAPVVTPKVVMDSIGEDVPFVYRAEFDVFPSLSEEQIKALKLTEWQVEVAASDEELAMNRLREHHVEWNPVERPLASGDQVSFLYEMAEGDGEVAEFSDDSKDLVLVVKPDTFLEEAHAELLGMRAGDEKLFRIDFPVREAHPFSGQSRQFRVRIKEVREPVEPSLEDSAFLQKFDCASLDDLRALVCRHLDSRRSELLRKRHEEQIVHGLVASSALAVPVSLEQWCLEVRARESGLEQVPEGEHPLRAAARHDAQHITVYQVLRNLSAIEPSEEDRTKTRDAYLTQFRDPNAGREQIRRDTQTRDHLEREATWTALIRWVLERAEVTRETLSMEQLQEGQK